MPISEETILTAMRQVRDPELLVNIVDLGLIYETLVNEVEGKSNVLIKMTMTSPACPFGPQLLQEVKDVVGVLPDIGTVDVELVLSPPWTPDRMSENARDDLGLF
jgi:metal-sulfur cluster biosynthetic enzyme